MLLKYIIVIVILPFLIFSHKIAVIFCYQRTSRAFYYCDCRARYSKGKLFKNLVNYILYFLNPQPSRHETKTISFVFLRENVSSSFSRGNMTKVRKTFWGSKISSAKMKIWRNFLRKHVRFNSSPPSTVWHVKWSFGCHNPGL